MLFKKTLLIVLAASALFLAGCSPSAGVTPASTAQELVLRFAIMGDTALEGPTPSTANIPELQRNIMDMASLSPVPSLSFMTGDLVVNLAPDQGQMLTTQLDAWQTGYSSTLGAGSFQLVPLPGNHESDVYDQAGGFFYPNPFIYPVWKNWLARNHYDTYAGSGPTPASDPQDNLAMDEQNFSYSFTLKGICFIVINTDTLPTILDPATSKPYAAWIPLHWIEEQLNGAQANPSISQIFLVAHRPLEAPAWTTPANCTPVLNNPTYPLATQLEGAMNACSKVRGYLCSHVHAQDMTQLPGGAGIWQIVSGNSGAPLASDWIPVGGQYNGFMIVNVYAGGKVGVVNYRRPITVPPAAAVADPEIFIN